jgi:hypothetical protein
MIGFWIALLLHLPVGYLYLVSGLVVPAVGLLPLGLLWAGLLVLLVRHRQRPFVSVAVPLGALGIWFGILWFGGTVLGWTA